MRIAEAQCDVFKMFFCPKSRNIQFTVMNRKKEQIVTFNLEPENIWHFCFIDYHS